MFLDIQIGHSTVAAELEPLIPFLQRPYVHLALDPEFAMKIGGVPGQADRDARCDGRQPRDPACSPRW